MSDFDDVKAMPGHLIRRCQQIAVALFLDECSGHSLTPVQFAVLCAIADNSGVEQNALAGLVAIDRSTVGNVVSRLEGRTLLMRKPDPADRRLKRVRLTPAGRRLIDEVRPAVERTQDRLLAPLDADERRTFVACLARIADINNDASRAPLGAVGRRNEKMPA
jgi:DNA-binding MarR family transcriptional regulator